MIDMTLADLFGGEPIDDPDTLDSDGDFEITEGMITAGAKAYEEWRAAGSSDPKELAVLIFTAMAAAYVDEG